MSNNQIRAIIARRKAMQKKAKPTGLQAACIAAAGFAEHHSY